MYYYIIYQARKAFERALNVDPLNVEALASLAILKKSNTKNDRKTNYKEARDLLLKAMSINPKNSLVLSQLADYFFFYSWTSGGVAKVVSGSDKIETVRDLSANIVPGLQIRLNNTSYKVKEINITNITLETPYNGETSNTAEVTYKNYQQVITYGKNALQHTDNAHIKGESNFFIARAYHILGDYNSAYIFYSEAERLKFGLAYYGLAQMLYSKGELREARKHLVNLIRLYPECNEAREFLGIIAKQLSQETKEFMKILKVEPNHINALIHHASYLMKSPYTKIQQEACKTYNYIIYRFEKAIKLSEQNNKPILFEVLFNVASLYHMLKDYKKAEIYYNKVL